MAVRFFAVTSSSTGVTSASVVISDSRLSIAEVENGIVTVKFENGECVFSGVTGDMTSYKVNGKELMAEKNAEAAGFIPNLYRALIDNDARMRGTWSEGGLDSLKKSVKSFDAHINDGEIEIVSVFALKAKRKELYEVKTTYTVSSLGAIEVNAQLKVTGENAVLDIPRFGLTVELNRAFENVTYYGRGTVCAVVCYILCKAV